MIIKVVGLNPDSYSVNRSNSKSVVIFHVRFPGSLGKEDPRFTDVYKLKGLVTSDSRDNSNDRNGNS